MSCQCPSSCRVSATNHQISHWHPSARSLSFNGRDCVGDPFFPGWGRGNTIKKVWIGLKWSPKNRQRSMVARGAWDHIMSKRAATTVAAYKKLVDRGERERYLTSKLTTLLACHIVCWPRRRRPTTIQRHHRRAAEEEAHRDLNLGAVDGIEVVWCV